MRLSVPPISVIPRASVHSSDAAIPQKWLIGISSSISVSGMIRNEVCLFQILFPVGYDRHTYIFTVADSLSFNISIDTSSKPLQLQPIVYWSLKLDNCYTVQLI